MLRLVQILKSRPLACFLLLLTSSLLISLSTPRGEIIMTVWWSLRNQDIVSFVNFAILVTAPSWLPERNFSKFALIWWSLIKSMRCRWVGNPGWRQLGWPRRAASNQVFEHVISLWCTFEWAVPLATFRECFQLSNPRGPLLTSLAEIAAIPPYVPHNQHCTIPPLPRWEMRVWSYSWWKKLPTFCNLYPLQTTSEETKDISRNKAFYWSPN